MTGKVGSCALAAKGQAAAAPPRSVMNSRRRHSITSSARPSSESGTVEAERLGGLEVDDQLDFRGLLDRQIGGLLAFENPASVDADLTVRLRKICLRSSSGRRPQRTRE